MPYLTPDGAQGLVALRLIAQENLIPPIVGGLDSMADPCAWELYGDLTPEETADIIGDAVDSLVVERYIAGYSNGFSKNIFDYSSANGTWSLNYYPNSRTKQIDSNAGTVAGDYIEFSVPLSAGTWTIDAYFVKWPSGGIATITLDGTQVGTFDCYKTSPTTYNNLFSMSGVVVGSSGNKPLRISANSKNASATKYQAVLCDLTFTRTGD